MIAITCSACHKKLSAQENLAGQKVKCPGCGQGTVVPMAVATGVTDSEDLRTLPRALGPDAAAPGDISGSPTNPPSGNPDATVGINPEAGPDFHLIDFLAPPQAADELGRLGQYRILRILGHGGMGVVYEAEDPKLKRTVAIKAMLPALAASASCGKRFLREAEAMAQVEHDHIVRIYEISEERDIPFMAMEFLKGEPLDARLKRAEPIPLADLLRIGREIAEGLAAAHAKVLIHRDIKPGNIWLESRGAVGGDKKPGHSPLTTHHSLGRVKILDFGLARAASQEVGLTQQGAIIGTPSYMAPEQGRGGQVDARCDLFSLGVVLYRMSTGGLPFRGTDTVSTLMAVATHKPPAPIKLNRALPRAFSDLVMKLLEKDPADRPASADAVIKTLEGIEKNLAMQKLSEEKTEALDVVEVKYAITVAAPRAKTTQSSPPKSAAKPREKSAAALIALAVGLVAVFGTILLGVGAIVFYWQTNNGTVRIEINDPNIQVAFDQNGPTFKGIDKHELKIASGEHGLHVKRGDLEFDTDKFILKRGETITLKIEWFKDGKVQVAQGGRVIGAKELPKVDDPVPAGPPADFALRFGNARDLVSIPTLGLDMTIPFTMEGYFKQTEFAGGNQTPLRWTSQASLKSIVVTTYRWNFFVPAAGNNFRLITDAPVVLDKTVHVAAVSDTKQFRLYVNGALVGAKDIDAEKPAQGNKIGFEFGHQFTGVIDEVRISNVARYDKDFTPAGRFEPDKGTVALYHFDEGAGNVLKDASGNNHHGTIVGAQWVKADSFLLPGQALDLLAAVELPRDVLSGAWKKEGGTLVRLESPVTGPTGLKLFTPNPMPEEYDLELVAERLSVGNPGRILGGGLGLGFLMQGSQATVNMDITGNPSSWALEMVDGKAAFESPTRVVGARLAVNQKKTVRVEVRKQGVRVFCDDEKVIDWHGQPAQLAPHPYWKAAPGALYLGAELKFRFHKLTLTPVTPTDGPTIPPPVAGAYALRYDGKARVDVPSLVLPVHGPLSIEAYMTLLAPPPTIANLRIIGKTTQAYLSMNSAGVAFNTFQLTSASKTATQGLPPLGKRFHIAGVRTDSEIRLFIDGRMVRKFVTLDQDLKPGSPVAKVVIGFTNFQGILEEVRFSKVARYDTDFTPAQRFVPDADTLALYHFDEGQGNVLKDSSGNNHHGAIVGAQWVKADGTPMSAPALLYALPFMARGIPGFAANSWRTDFSADGQFFLAAGDANSAGNVPIWETATGKLAQELVPTNGVWFSNAKFLPGGKFVVATYSLDKDLYLWETATGKIVRKFVGHTAADPEFALAPDGKSVLSWAADKTLRLWEVETGKELRKLEGHTDRAAGVFSPDSTRILTFSPDKTLRLWDAATGKELKKLSGHTEPPAGRFSPDGKHALSYGADQTIRLWDLITGAEIRQYGDVLFKVGFAGFVADGQRVVGYSDDKKYRVWETATAKLVREIDCVPFGLAVHDHNIAASPDGRLVLSTHSDGSVRVLELETGKEIHRYANCPAARAFAFSPDGTLAMAGSFRRGVYVFRLPPPAAGWLDPAWLKQVAAMPPPQQVKAVADKLMERNPGFDGKVTHKLGDDGAVAEFEFFTDNVTDLAPVRALNGLRMLRCNGSQVGKGRLADLSPLKALKLTLLDCYYTKVADLTPLKDMKLTELNCGGAPVTDLAPLKDMKLTRLQCGTTNVSDLAPLRGMPLTHLDCWGTKVSDLAPLQGMPLTKLECYSTPVSDLAPLKDMDLTILNCSGTKVADLAPLKDMKRIWWVGCSRTNVSDLAPLRGLPLKTLYVDFRPERDAEILRSIKTLETINGKAAREFLQ